MRSWVMMLVMMMVMMVVVPTTALSPPRPLEEEQMLEVLLTLREKIEEQESTIQRLKNEKSSLESRLQQQGAPKQSGYISRAPPEDCQDLRDHHGVRVSGVYQIFPTSCREAVNVRCEMDHNKAWTVILDRHRQNPQENFNRTWRDYKTGFGLDLPLREYWLGNDNIHALTTNGRRSYSLKVVATNLKGEEREAVWSSFRVSDENNRYKLSLGQYSRGSTLGDALTGSSSTHDSSLAINGMFFTTWDRDNDQRSGNNCGSYVGAGWWFNNCGYAHLTAPIGNRNDYWLVMNWKGFYPDRFIIIGLSEVKMMIGRA